MIYSNMSETTLTLQPKSQADKFYHPYTPYDVQLDFMKAVYGVLEKGDGQIGIIESPTGTGKSLSLICSAMTWLRQHKSLQFDRTVDEMKEKYVDEPDWIVDQLLSQKRQELAAKWEEREEKLEKIRQNERDLEKRATKRRRMEETRFIGGDRDDDEDRFLLDDMAGDSRDENDPLSGLSKETRNLLSSLGLGGPRSKDDEEEAVEEPLKIFYASRTHSQLSQFISELRRPHFPSSLPSSLRSCEPGKASDELVKVVPLSSRKNLCINPLVTRLSSVQAINDRCAEMAQGQAGGKCRYMPGEELISQTHQFRDTTWATLPDIEDMAKLGKKLSVCPYYASRTAVPGAEIITLPYQLLLQKSARDTLGIKIEGNIVIIDEAHNIMDAIASVHAASIKLSELRRGRQMLGVYIQKFGKKLKPENRVQVGRVGRIMECLTSWLMEARNEKAEHGIVSATSLLSRKGADQINLYKLVQYVQESKLAYKIEGYVSHVETEQAKQEGKPAAAPTSTKPVLQTLVSFLLALTNLSFEGRIFFQKLEPRAEDGDIQLSYLLLSPTQAFSSIASSARAVVLAGGTMSPFDDYTSHLFPQLPASKITTLSCGHVIPASNLCVWTLGKGQELPFEFSFQRRSDKGMINQLGMSLLNMCAVIPDGVVVFFPSYGYLDEVVRVWQGNGKDPNSIWTRLQSRKSVFRESKTASSDEILQAYTEAIMGSEMVKPGKGALLLGVVGGKMSEGINFSDELGRCVVVVGLPFPNINSPDWKAKMEYIETAAVDRLTKPVGDTDGQSKAVAPMSREQAVATGKKEARNFYENACMRAVNQSIGRAIRHRNDYAAIILADRRYGTPRIQEKLPGWIRSGMAVGSHEKGLPELMGALGAFFRSKKSI